MNIQLNDGIEFPSSSLFNVLFQGLSI